MIDWSKSKVLLTGGAGFLGRRVAACLRERGARTVVVPRSATCDLVDGSAVRRVMEEATPDVVLHLAARIGGIGASREHPAGFFRDNAMMGIQVMHEAWAYGVAKLVAVSSVCAYPGDCPVPFREEQLWSGPPQDTHVGYGVAKRILSTQAEAYRAEYGFGAVVVCPTNLYGPGDNFDRASGHVIPAMLLELERARRAGVTRVEFWGDGTPTRDFLYVDDCARGIVLAAERYDAPGPLNLSSGTGITMAELADRIAAIVGFRGEITWDARKPNGQQSRVVDPSRAREAIGFAPTVSLDDGLVRTCAWMREHLLGDS